LSVTNRSGLHTAPAHADRAARLHDDAQHPLEIVEALRRVLTGFRARDRIAHEKDADLRALPLHQRPGESEPIVGALRPVGGIVQDEERLQRLAAGFGVREKKVTCSMTECQCGGMRYPAGNRSRNVNGTASAGFPSSSTNSAPAGSDGGPGAHARLGACATITCDAGADAAGVWAVSAAGTSAAATSATVQRSDMTASKEWVPERSPRSGHRTNTKFLYITLVKAYDQLTKPGLTLHRLELFLAVLDSGAVARARQ